MRRYVLAVIAAGAMVSLGSAAIAVADPTGCPTSTVSAQGRVEASPIGTPCHNNDLSNRRGGGLLGNLPVLGGLGGSGGLL